jgi:hypothetical protein
VLESEKREREKDLAGAAKTQLSLAHRTVRWCTGQCLVREASSGKLATLGKTSVAYGYNSPDYLVSQRPPAQRSAAKSAGDAWLAPTVGRGHRTVSGAPTATNLQRLAAPDLEGNRALDINSSCPVAH